MKFGAAIAITLALGFTSAFAAESAIKSADQDAAVPQRVEADLEPAGVAPGTTVREANIRQNWLLLGLGSAALAGLIFGLSSSSDATSTTN